MRGQGGVEGGNVKEEVEGVELRRKERLQPRNVDGRGWRRQEGLFSLVSVHAKAAAHVENYVYGGDGTRIWEER